MFSTRSREPNDGPEMGRRDVSSDLPTTSIRENDVPPDRKHYSANPRARKDVSLVVLLRMTR